MNVPLKLARSLVIAFAALTGSACHVAGAKMHNLDELHWTDGRHKRTGLIWNDYEYVIRVGIYDFLRGFGSTGATNGDPEKIKDPLETCVKNLNGLNSFDANDPWIAARQVEYCSRLAVDDPWQISREIAVVELGDHSERLHMREHPWKKPEGEPAGVEAVREALRRLIQASGPVLKDKADDAETAEFVAACDGIRALTLEREGALRLLKSVAIIEHSRVDKDGRLAPLHELSLHLQRTCVSLALTSAVADDPPGERNGSDPGWRKGRVQGAAIEACARAWGPETLGRLMLEFTPRDPDPDRLIGFLSAVRHVGLPPPPAELDEAKRARAPDTWTSAIYLIATENPDSRVRLAAMAALGKITGREPYSVREEDWQEWWLTRKSEAAAGSVAQ